MNRLDHYEIVIIRYLGKRGASTINQISQGCKISWVTANGRIKRLYNKGYLSKNGLNWSLKYK